MTTLTISDETGDCTGLGVATFDATGQTCTIGKSAGGDDWKTWLPFVVPLDKSLVITSATLKVIASGNLSADTMRFKVGCEAADNPAAPILWAQLDGRTLSTAYNTQSFTTNWTAGTEYTFDITTAVQEILDRAGWASGQTMAVLIIDNGSDAGALREFASEENTTKNPPVLEIIYTPSSGKGQVIIWSSE